MNKRLLSLLAFASMIVIIASFFMRLPGEWFNQELLIISLYFAVAYWLLMLLTVASTHRLNRHQKIAWLLLIIFVPFVAALLYQLLHHHTKKHLRSIKASKNNFFQPEQTKYI